MEKKMLNPLNPYEQNYRGLLYNFIRLNNSQKKIHLDLHKSKMSDICVNEVFKLSLSVSMKLIR